MMDNHRQTLGNFAMVALLFLGFIFIYHWSFIYFSTQLLLFQHEPLCQQQSNKVPSNHTYICIFFLILLFNIFASNPCTYTYMYDHNKYSYISLFFVDIKNNIIFLHINIFYKFYPILNIIT